MLSDFSRTSFPSPSDLGASWFTRGSLDAILERLVATSSECLLHTDASDCKLKFSSIEFNLMSLDSSVLAFGLRDKCASLSDISVALRKPVVLGVEGGVGRFNIIIGGFGAAVTRAVLPWSSSESRTPWEPAASRFPPSKSNSRSTRDEEPPEDGCIDGLRDGELCIVGLASSRGESRFQEPSRALSFRHVLESSLIGVVLYLRASNSLESIDLDSGFVGSDSCTGRVGCLGWDIDSGRYALTLPPTRSGAIDRACPSDSREMARVV
mmetsp:Transcript_81337/g.218737  ORF Transcript_81337/g.218737 Transcript_81337/m.218737 type:complete len:267 (+) Transcript_81337:494-1294(+)